MGFLNRFKTGQPQALAATASARTQTQTSGRTGSVAVAEPNHAPRGANTRSSNCLKDFLWHLSGIGRGTLLDLGPIYQNTVQFFGERGFRVYTEDIITGLNRFTREQESAVLALQPGDERPTRTQAAQKFLESALEYGPRSFDAILAWDMLDYMDDDMRVQAAERLTGMLRDGGVILAIFHSKRPDQFRRYRVIDETTVELVNSAPLAPFGKIFQNREMMDLFGGYHSSKTYLGRDQVREALFIK